MSVQAINERLPSLLRIHRRVLFGVLLVALLAIIAACAAPASVPVVERAQPPTERINSHWVAEGETLYAIAWRYNMDYRELASANGLRSPYSIKAGQRLSLLLHGSRTSSESRHKATQGQPVAKASRNSTQSRPVSRTSVGPRMSDRWQWPSTGRVGRQFSTGHKRTGQGAHKGIDIDGKSGQSVLASNAGTVVYAGNGLKAYGNLVIVKHDDVFLSAYAHNRRLLVREGQQVAKGEKIAEMGSSGATRTHLHFEIRQRGKPVNPLKFVTRPG